MYITQELLNEREQFLRNRDFSENTILNYKADTKLFLNFIRLQNKAHYFLCFSLSQTAVFDKSFGKKMFFFAVTEPRTRSKACAMGNSFLRTIALRAKWKTWSKSNGAPKKPNKYFDYFHDRLAGVAKRLQVSFSGHKKSGQPSS